MSDDIRNLILRTIEEWAAGRFTERHGLVTSYDPKLHLAKVTFQPEGQESGWLPIETGHIGNGYGIATGLTTGDGKATGDQVIIRFQEGDFEGGKIVQRVHSDQDKPPEVQSGETVIWTKWGQKVYLKNDGSMTLTDGQGATTVFDGKGNIAHTVKNMTINASESCTFTAGKGFNINGSPVDINK